MKFPSSGFGYYGLGPFFYAYIVGWATACLIAIGLVVRRPADFEITGVTYRRYLLQPWKIATFVVAAAVITFIAPYTGDPTWDYFDALMMSVLTFATAPWVTGTLYRALQRTTGVTQVYVALCALLFSASWCYDIYLVYRDGIYPLTWSSNMIASSILYLLAGMLWNLEWRPGRGIIFGFMEATWPDLRHAGGATKLTWYALLIMTLAGLLVLPFLWGGWN